MRRYRVVAAAYGPGYLQTMSALRPGIILDRDGTLIDMVRDETSGLFSVAFHPRHLVFLPGVITGLSRLSQAGFVLALATNQPGPAKGEFSRSAVELTHQALVALLAASGLELASLHTCFHHPQGGSGGAPALILDCNCRKPKPGLLFEALAQSALDPARSWMVGDSPGDVLAAHAAGIRSALIFSGKRCELCPLREGPSVQPSAIAADFAGIVEAILQADARLKGVADSPQPGPTSG